MRRPMSEGAVGLKAREVLDLRDGEGLAVTCLEGNLWITQEDDPDDVVLRAGQSFVIDRPGLTLVSSPVGPSTVLVRAAARAAPPMSARPSGLRWRAAA